HDTGRLVWAAPGRSSATVGEFFDLLGPERCAAITHVSADGADFIDTILAQRCPGAPKHSKAPAARCGRTRMNIRVTGAQQYCAWGPPSELVDGALRSRQWRAWEPPCSRVVRHANCGVSDTGAASLPKVAATGKGPAPTLCRGRLGPVPRSA